MKTLTIETPLVRKEETHGITVYENKEIKMQYFTTHPFWDEKKKMISCPDGRSSFNHIEVYPHVVVCKLDFDAKIKLPVFRVYLRDKKTWLSYPTDPGIINYAEVIKVDKDFLHLYLGVKGKVVYVFKTSKWIEVPIWYLGSYQPLRNFESTSTGVFQERPCLFLQTRDKRNPISIFFLDKMKFFSIAPLPESDDSGCNVFNKIFPTYVVVGVGDIVSSRSNYFFIWRIKEGNFFFVQKGDSVDPEDYKFSRDLFTKDHIAVPSNISVGYQVISTKTWKEIEVQFVFKKKTNYIEKVKVENGEMTVSITTSCDIETNI